MLPPSYPFYGVRGKKEKGDYSPPPPRAAAAARCRRRCRHVCCGSRGPARPTAASRERGGGRGTGGGKMAVAGGWLRNCTKVKRGA